MKVVSFFLLAGILLGTAEAGLRHVYENLYVFLAYRFELENVEEGDRIIGIKCASADQATLRCLPPGNPQYKRCVGTATVEAKGGKMTDASGLRDFLSHISGNNGAHLKGEPYDGADARDYRSKVILGAGLENSGDFDVHKAARRMYEEKIDLSSPAWCKVKDGRGLYLPSFERIAMRVGSIKAAMSVDSLENNKRLFQRLDACADGVITDRRADMSKYLIPYLEKAVKRAHAIRFTAYPGGKRLFSYRATLQSIRDSVQGLGDNKESSFQSRKRILDYSFEEFGRTKEATDHQPPIEKWGLVKARMFPVHGCEQRPANWPAGA